MDHVTYHFNFHDLLRMRIADTVGFSDRALMRPMRGYVHHHVEPEPGFEPDIDIAIAPFGFAERPHAIVDRRFRVGEDYFACEDTYKILWWKLEMEGFESGRTRMKIHRNVFGTAAIGSRLTDCMLRFQLARRGAPAVHCCGVVNDDGAYLLSGRSGVGKSTTAMQLMNDGYRLLGDNWVMVHEGEALSLHLPLNVHDYNVSPRVLAKMPPRLRFDLWYRTLARKLSGGFLKKATPVILKDFFPELVAERAPLRKVLTFSQGESLDIRPIGREPGIRRIVANDMMDREAFYRYMLAYACVHPEGPVGTYWGSMHGRLSAAIPEDVGFIEVTVPRRVTGDVVARIRDALES